MENDDWLDRQLDGLADRRTPLPPSLRGAILTDAAAATTPRGLPWRMWLGALPAALTGIWIGMAQPALVLQTIPGLSGDDAVLLEDVFPAAAWDLSQ